MDTRRRSPARELRDEDDERRSVDLKDIDVLDQCRSFPVAEVQPTRVSDLLERSSFPALEMSGGDIAGGRCSFPGPELGDIDTSGRR